jgi:hypothetical protein
MVSGSNNWIRVSHADPCPVCGYPDNCTVSRDGVMVWCGRVSDGSLRENKGGQYLHRLRDEVLPPYRVPLPLVTLPQKAKRTDLPNIASAWAKHAEPHRIRLAGQLGIPVAGLNALDVGWNPSSRCWSFPEKDGSGKIIGINTRHEDGSKKRLAGGRAGLTYPEIWNSGTGPVFLVEGGSDTAALVGIGLNVIGRPSNLGGVALLTDMLSDLSSQQDIIVLGERDEKPDGRWPGKEGAVKTARRLADNLNRTVLWALPPDNAKDARDWLQGKLSLSIETAAELFCSGLATHELRPPLQIVVPQPEAPVVSLTDWRQAMYESRLESLETPGYYLDSSTTGTGKSFVDVSVIIHVLQGGFG